MTTLANIKAIKIENNRIELSVNNKNQPVARLYKVLTAGKNKGEKKLVEGFYFQNEETRSAYVANIVTKLNERAAEKAKQEEIKKELSAKFEHPYKVGDVVYASWGYEQTNIDFYQITELKGKTATLRSIAGEMVKHTSHDSGRVKPSVNEFTDETLKKIIQLRVDSKNEACFYIRKDDVRGCLYAYDQGENGIYCSWSY